MSEKFKYIHQDGDYPKVTDGEAVWCFAFSIDGQTMCDLLNGQDKEIRTLANQLSVADDTIEDLLNEIEQLKTQLVNSVFVDMDNGNGCYNCKWDSGGICEKLMKGSLGYIKEVSWCNLKHWELLE